MKIERIIIKYDNIEIPAVQITPDNPIGVAVITHGYGGCKEETLGLAWRIAEVGLAAITIDLRGHGENILPLDDGILPDVNASIKFGKQFGKVIAIGHSLGGRLSLLSDADFVIAISPALNQEFSEMTQNIIKTMRGHRVKESSPGALFDILGKLPRWKSKHKNHMILFGTRDVPEIVKECQNISLDDPQVFEIENALHGDTFIVEASFKRIIDQINTWYK